METVAEHALFRRAAGIAVGLLLSFVAACVVGTSTPMPWVSGDILHAVDIGRCRVSLVYRPYPVMNGDVVLDMHDRTGRRLLRRVLSTVDVREDAEVMSITVRQDAALVVGRSDKPAVAIPAECRE